MTAVISSDLGAADEKKLVIWKDRMLKARTWARPRWIVRSFLFRIYAMIEV